MKNKRVISYKQELVSSHWAFNLFSKYVTSQLLPTSWVEQTNTQINRFQSSFEVVLILLQKS
jgi:hypothetical protein